MKQLIKKSKIKQKWLAEKLGITQSALSVKIKNNRFTTAEVHFIKTLLS